MPRELARSVGPALRGSVAPLLLLLTPFVVFLRHHGYDLGRPEVVLCIAVMAAVALAVGAAGSRWRWLEVLGLSGLLTLFADIQFHPPKGTIGLGVLFLVFLGLVWLVRRHAARIVTLAVGAMLVSSLVFPESRVTAEHGQPRQGDPGLPLLVHLVLDEHIGLEGLPPELTPAPFRDAIQGFYDRHGFRVFGRAYSQHFTTYRSLAHLVNATADRYAPELFVKGKGAATWDLVRNEYFTRLGGRGYALRVYQTDYLDLCAPGTFAAWCETYDATTLRVLAPLDLAAPEKASVVAAMYLDRSTIYSDVRHIYRAVRNALSSSTSVRLPPWTSARTRINAISTMSVLDRVIADVARARRGQAVFAHLLLPHYPYAYDEQCRPRPPSEWVERMDRDAPAGTVNTTASRAERYREYFAQTRCLYRKLDELFAAIPSALRTDAVIVLEGDHGSRITRVEPGVGRRHRLTAADYADSYSTLFAVRAPGVSAGHDPRVAPIPCLLGAFNRTDFRDDSGVGACTSSPVFMSTDESTPVAVPLVPFW